MRYVRKFYRVTNQRVGDKIVEVSRELLREVETKRVTTTVQAAKSATDEVADYFTSMGVSAEIMKPLLATPATQMHILTRTELNATQLATERIGTSPFSGDILLDNLIPKTNMIGTVTVALAPPKDSLTLSFLDLPASGAGMLSVMITTPLSQRDDQVQLNVDLHSDNTFPPNTHFRLRLDFGHGNLWDQKTTNSGSSAMNMAFTIDRAFICHLPASSSIDLEFEAHHNLTGFNMPMKVFNARQFFKLDDAQNKICRP